MKKKDLTERFWSLHEEYKFESTTISMFFYLLYIQNQNRNKKFTVTDSLIFANLCINKNTIKPIREKLNELNLINVNIEKGKAPVYDLLNFNTEELNSVSKVNKKKKVTPAKKNKNLADNIPTLNEVMDFVQQLEIYQDGMDDWFKIKYLEWIDNGWANSLGSPITDYKAIIKASAPFYKNTKSIKIELPTNENIIK